jgi:hypothetical protein
VKAKVRLEEATQGLQPHEAIKHLETTLAHTEIEASRHGIQFDAPDSVEAQLAGSGGDGTPVVVIQRFADADES